MTPTDTTLLVPAYNAGAFIEETLESIRAQTHRHFRVVISVDAGTDDTAARCRPFLRDERFTLLEQPARLGWLGNSNALIARVETPLFAITPHDDLLHPDYLGAVHEVVRSDARVSCAYSDIQAFGNETRSFTQPDIRGDTLDRVIDVLLHHYAAVAYRGLVRRRDAHDRPLVPTGIPGDFFADTAWLVPLALRGELRRVPRALYRKRYDGKTAHQSWIRASRRTHVRRHAALIARCVELALDALPAESHAEVIAAATLRVSGLVDLPGWGIPATPVEVALAVSDFRARLGDRWRTVDVAEVGTTSRVEALRRAAVPLRRAARHGTLVHGALALAGRALHRVAG